MASHWQTLGFAVDSMPSLADTMQQVLSYAQAHQIPTRKYEGQDFDYYRVPIGGDGLEVWLVWDKRDPAYVMAHPHFAGRSRLRVQLAEAIDAGGGDVAYYAYANPTGQNKILKRIDAADGDTAMPEMPDCSFHLLMSPPNGQHTLTFLNRDDIVTVQCTGFCEQIKIYRDEAAYIAGQKPMDMGTQARKLMGGVLAFEHQLNKPVYLGAQRFISLDLIRGDEDSDDAPGMEANIAGIVRESRRLVNPLTQRPYYWALVSSADDQPFDITLSPEESDLPQAGNIIDGTFWLSARFIGSEQEAVNGL